MADEQPVIIPDEDIGCISTEGEHTDSQEQEILDTVMAGEAETFEGGDGVPDTSGGNDAGNDEADQDGEAEMVDDRKEEDKTDGDKTPRVMMDPSKGFVENEQDKMIAGSWQYRVKLLAMNYNTREMNHENIEKLVNISQNAAMYYKFGKLELLLASQVTGQLAMEKILKMNIPSKPLSLYLMRRNGDVEEVAFLKLLPRASHQIHFGKGQTSEQLGGNPLNRSVCVSNLPEGTSDELLQALFPFSISITKPEDKEGTVMVECIDEHSARQVVRSYIKVQISHNVLSIVFANKPEGEEDGAKSEDGEKKETPKKFSSAKNKKPSGKRPFYQPYPRGGRGGARGRGRGGYTHGSYGQGGGYGQSGDRALHQQIAMLQQNISMLTQSINPMMMRGQGGMDGMGGRGMGSGVGMNRPPKRRRLRGNNQSGNYGSDDYSYGGSRSNYGSSVPYGGGMQSSNYNTSGGYGGGSGMGGSGGSGSWGTGASGMGYNQGGNSRKRSYMWNNN